MSSQTEINALELSNNKINETKQINIGLKITSKSH